MEGLPEIKTIIEPFRIKSVEALPMPTIAERHAHISKAHYNLFALDADKVTFDLLTDSGTGAMSNTQWAGIMMGDESYAGSNSYRRFESVVQDLTQMDFVVPTHQGRAAEYLLMSCLLQDGMSVVGNTHFDTTRANIEEQGCQAIDFPVDTQQEILFPGNIDVIALGHYLEKNSDSVAMAIVTVTNNSVGGLPVSLENIKVTKEILKHYNIPLFLDIARFAENAYFIKRRSQKHHDHSIKHIAQEMFSYADGLLMSAKKDGFGNIGGFLAIRNRDLVDALRSKMVVTEGFPTYGGLAGRDLEALAVGLTEILDERYLNYRIRSVEYFGQGIESAGYNIVRPIGGHAVYIDAGKCLPHLTWENLPGQALSVALYEYIGIRSVEVGTVMLGYRNKKTGDEMSANRELLRLAMPRRVYTQSHVDFMIESMANIQPLLQNLPAYSFAYQADVLRHFTARFNRSRAPGGPRRGFRHLDE